MKRGATRQNIVKAADDLFYRQGFECTTFADVTDAVNISRGNLYHHFKAKDDILDAVIQARMNKTQETLGCWDMEGETPIDRIEMYLQSLLENWGSIREHGCPVGSLCNELAKLDHSLREDSVEILALYRDWLRRQFLELQPVDDPDDLAMKVLVWSQGVAITSNAFKDLSYVEREVQNMSQWLRALPVK